MSQIKSGESARRINNPRATSSKGIKAAKPPLNRHMPDEPTPEQWQRTIETLLETAERCYRLARGITDSQAIEALLRLAEECEVRAEELRESPP